MIIVDKETFEAEVQQSSMISGARSAAPALP